MFLINAQKIFQQSITQNGFSRVIDKSELISIADGKCTAYLKIKQEYLNQFGVLHGGFSATLVDCFSSIALLTKGANKFVTSDMHLSYLKDAKINNEILINSLVLKFGAKMAFLETSICDKVTNQIFVRGYMTSFILK